MTDAREIIAKALSPAGENPTVLGEWISNTVITALKTAGFRILGPDEVDQVTVEKCADTAEERAEWVPLKAGDMRAAILSIVRKPRS